MVLETNPKPLNNVIDESNHNTCVCVDEIVIVDNNYARERTLA